MSETREYVVIGPGWSNEYLQPTGPSGDIAYRGHSLTEARRELARCRASVRRVRRQPGNQDASDTYHIRVQEEDGRWVPLEGAVPRTSHGADNTYHGREPDAPRDEEE